eukprot:Platyproteum_vivax@DN7197_c0_g1_i1.p1
MYNEYFSISLIVVLIFLAPSGGGEVDSMPRTENTFKPSKLNLKYEMVYVSKRIQQLGEVLENLKKEAFEQQHPPISQAEESFYSANNYDCKTDAIIEPPTVIYDDHLKSITYKQGSGVQESVGGRLEFVSVAIVATLLLIRPQ